MRYAIVIEKARKNYSAYSPDVPGCITTGKTVQQTLKNMREALLFHFDGLREDGQAIPDPQALVDYIELPAKVAGHTSRRRRNGKTSAAA